MSDCLIVHNDTRKSMFPPDTPCSQRGHDCWMETWLSSFHKFRRASLYRERRQTSPSWHRWNSISEQLPAKISGWISSTKGKTTLKYLYCSFQKWTFKIWCATECIIYETISYETCSVSSLNSLQVFFRAKSNKNVSVIYDPKCFNTRLKYMCCSDCRFRYETSARVAESAATDSEGSVYGGFDGFNHSNYTTSLTPNYAQSVFSRRATILHVKHRRSGDGGPESDLQLQPASQTKSIPRRCRSKEARANHLIEGTKTRLAEASGGILLLRLSTWAFGISSRNKQMPHSAEIRAAAGPTPRVGKEKDGEWGIEPPKPDQCTASTSGGSRISSYWSQN